jgi:type IV secretion system protein VirB2
MKDANRMTKLPVPSHPSQPRHRAVLSLALLTTVTALAPQFAYAQSAAPVEGILDWFVGVLQGNVARSLAIIAVCFLGFLFLTGRMAWQGAISIIIGIAIIFGAAQLVDAMKSSAGV